MTCQLSVVANIQDVLSIRKLLFPEEAQETKKNDFQTADAGWDDPDWGNWEVEEEKEATPTPDFESSSVMTSSGTSSAAMSSSWIQGTQMSMSPTGDLMVFASEDKIVYLAQKWDAKNEDVQTKYSVVYDGSPVNQPGEQITCVFCLPLASHKKSLQGSPDWTCVIVGFSTGYVRIYTENGTLLMSQLFAEEPVVQIRCTTYAPPRHDREGERAEEILLLFSQSMAVIDGFSFQQAVKACKNQAARAAASGNDLVETPPLAYKKWGFKDQEVSKDMIPCGYAQPTIFDQMMCDSISKGPNCGIRTSLYSSHLYLTVGRAPCINFFHTVQTAVQPQLSDVANVVASKLKTAFLSAASGWLGLSSAQSAEPKEKKKLKLELDVPLTARYGLYDKRRVGEQVALSPDYKMAAATDSFGRVVLLDVARGVAVRMWKGYRDAQVGWIESRETRLEEDEEEAKAEMSRRFRMSEHDKEDVLTQPRRTCFLVIYAPRRGILEVWSAQSGPRVAAFSVPKTGRLVYPGYGMLGLNNATVAKPGRKSVNPEVARNRFDGLFFLDVDGTVKNLSVPFHLVFSWKSSRRTRDTHLLKQLVVLLKENKVDSGPLKSDILSLLKDIKTCFLRRQFLEKVLSTKYFSSSSHKEIIEAAVQFTTRPSAEEGGHQQQEEDSEAAGLLLWCRHVLNLLRLYDELSDLSDGTEDVRRRNDVEVDSKEYITDILVNQLKVEEHESLELSDVILRRLALGRMTSSSANRKTVTFEDKVMTPDEFVSCFELKKKNRRAPPGSPEKPDDDDFLSKRRFVGDGESGDDDDEVVPGEKLGDGDGTEEGAGKDDPWKSDGGDVTGTAAGHVTCLVKKMNAAKLSKLVEFIFEAVRQGKMSVVGKLKNVFATDFLSSEETLNLLMNYVLSMELSTLQSTPFIHDLTSSLVEDIVDEMPSESISDWLLNRYASNCCQSENILAALILVLIGRRLSCEKLTLSSTNEADVDWEDVELGKEKWSRMTRQYQDLLVLENLLKVQELRSISRPDGASLVTISMAKVEKDGRASIPEVIGKFISSLGVPTRVFFAATSPTASTTSSAAADATRATTAISTPTTPPLLTPTEEFKPVLSGSSSSSSLSKGYEMDESILKEISVSLTSVKQHLPLTATTDVVVSNCCWEFMVRWNHDPEVNRSLELAFEYLEKIEDSTLRRGLAKMIWEMFIVKRLTAVVLLTEKVGKAPKDRLLRKDVGLSETSTLKFIEFAFGVLDTFLQEKDSLPSSYEEEGQHCYDRRQQEDHAFFQVENAWLDHVRGRCSSLLELATCQQPVESMLVLHHRSLCIVVKAILAFSMKSLKVFALYDSKGRDAFFKPLHSNTLKALEVADESVKVARNTFLERTIVQSVCLLGEAGTLNFEYDPAALTRETGYVDWLKLILELTQLFVVDPDFSVVRLAYQLYLSGFDLMAMEVLRPVSDRNAAGRYLMPVLGARLAPLIFCSDARKQACRTCICSTFLTNWLKKIDIRILRCLEVPNKLTFALSKLLVNLLDEDQPDYKLAKEVYELMPNF